MENKEDLLRVIFEEMGDVLKDIFSGVIEITSEKTVADIERSLNCIEQYNDPVKEAQFQHLLSLGRIMNAYNIRFGDFSPDNNSSLGDQIELFKSCLGIESL